MTLRGVRKLFLGIALSVFLTNTALAQQGDDPLMKIYRETPEKINDLVHTKLEVSFDYAKRYLYGKEWVTLKPHAYPTDSLRLDAKGMDIKELAIVKNGKNLPLKFSYDSLTLAITLDKMYLANEQYTLYIDYTSKPEQLKAHGSAAISDARGLYFINPDGADKTKPTQIWTQGESESSSAWFPTIDKPNQKTTDEISMRVSDKYVTLSNGRLASQKQNNDGTRTDTWKMELPHAPYLFMMAVGDFKIYKDTWHGKEVSYYLEPKYAPYAKDIFGYTPEVMDFYSRILGIDYPWNKYSQIVVRDYVSGAMENTTATLHGQQVQATRRELVDGKPESETDIVHELFHQWFGDYVTAESWSNLTVNESFADLSETLWAEYKHGKDAGDDVNYQAMRAYLSSAAAKTKPLVRYYYHDKEDVFDVVTYQKGGRILNMLRHYLGDTVFYKGLHIYLTQNALKTGEPHQLRLALEEASGQDLNWYFNQWYYRAGHPELKIEHKWNASTSTETVYLQQTQEGDAFILPMAVDVYVAGKKIRRDIWMRNKLDTLAFKAISRPDLVNVDADKITLCQKTEEKTQREYAFQYANAPLYVDRLEALNAAISVPDNRYSQQIILAALGDRYSGLRIKAIQAIDLKNDDTRKEALPILTDIIKTDDKTLVRAAAINVLTPLKNNANLPLFKQSISSPSYAVQGAALKGIAALSPVEAMKAAKPLEEDTGDGLMLAMVDLYMAHGGDDEYPFIANVFKNAPLDQKIDMMPDLVKLLGRISDTKAIIATVLQLKEMNTDYKAYVVTPYLLETLKNLRELEEGQARRAIGEQKMRFQEVLQCIDMVAAEIRG